jgi:HD superfamily phosphohydrolase
MTDEYSDLLAMVDAVHGRINIPAMFTPRELPVFIRLLHSPIIDRLRRIKLLGYAAYPYPAADHSRYAHALGTMHVMNLILNRLTYTKGFRALDMSSLRVFGQPRIRNRDQLFKHMILAALLQDVGELPYGGATKGLFGPNDQVRADVEADVGDDITGWSDKQIFTVKGIISERSLRDLDVNRSFLLFLINGHCRPKTRLDSQVEMLRHLVDGAVDADRLDYVYRDAYHTLGDHGSVSAVVNTLLFYDEYGPVFEEPGPVTDFLATRAHLWTNVYFSPQSRFRNLLLSRLRKNRYRRAFSFSSD